MKKCKGYFGSTTTFQFTRKRKRSDKNYFEALIQTLKVHSTGEITRRESGDVRIIVADAEHEKPRNSSAISFILFSYLPQGETSATGLPNIFYPNIAKREPSCDTGKLSNKLQNGLAHINSTPTKV